MCIEFSDVFYKSVQRTFGYFLQFFMHISRHLLYTLFQASTLTPKSLINLLINQSTMNNHFENSNSKITKDMAVRYGSGSFLSKINYLVNLLLLTSVNLYNQTDFVIAPYGLKRLRVILVWTVRLANLRIKTSKLKSISYSILFKLQLFRRVSIAW